MRKAVFFDLDGTILDGVSSENLFIWYLLSHGYLRWRQILCALLFVPRWLSRYGKHVFVKDKAYLAGLSVVEVFRLGEKFANDALIRRMRPTVVDRVGYHRERGDLTVLLTGSPSFLARTLSKVLSFDYCYPTECATMGGRFTCRPPVQHPFGENKEVIARAICAEHGIDIKDCVAYGNSINDAHLLKSVGTPIAVTPDHKLRLLAQSCGWEIMSGEL